MYKTIPAILAAILLVTIVGCSTTPTSVQHPAPFTTSATALSNNGLSLTIELDSSENSTTYQPGDPISISIEEKNTLPTVNSITAANEWPVFHYLAVSPCNTLNYPFGIAVLRGYHDAKHVSSATPLQVFPIEYCPSIAIAYSYDFQPSSDLAAVNTSSGSNPPPIRMNTDITLTGVWDKWTSSDGGTSKTTSNFAPGIYTLVGGDEWGTLVILYFSVS